MYVVSQNGALMVRVYRLFIVGVGDPDDPEFEIRHKEPGTKYFEHVVLGRYNSSDAALAEMRAVVKAMAAGDGVYMLS